LFRQTGILRETRSTGLFDRSPAGGRARSGQKGIASHCTPQGEPSDPALFFYIAVISFLWSITPTCRSNGGFGRFGDVVMILVVLSDTDWYGEPSRGFSRGSDLWLIRLSALFIRYFPELGRTYSREEPQLDGRMHGQKPAWDYVRALWAVRLLYYLMELYRRPREERARGLGLPTELLF